MQLNHLSLSNFRAFSRLDVDIPSGIVLLHGDNAQGKTSLLEAVYYLATFTSFITAQDAQVINFLVRDEDTPVARIVAEFQREEQTHRLEIRLIHQVNPDGMRRLRKEILLDGVKKSSQQVIGLFTAVVFIPQMTRLFENGPEERRKYMNLVLCQVIPGYASALTKYAQALTRRNALLKSLSERGGDPSQLDYWDALLIQHGSHLLLHRYQAMQEIDVLTAPIHAQLTGSREVLRLAYKPLIETEESVWSGDTALQQIQERYQKQLVARHKADIQRGVTTIGPHRDDLQFIVNGLDQSDYGSRGQIRTVLQSIKLGEVKWMTEKTGSAPVLLMDETLAELDSRRRQDLLSKLSSVDQALLTTTDEDLFVPDFLKTITRWEINAGRIISENNGVN
jgi:DNA replication and repair protein RecF